MSVNLDALGQTTDSGPIIWTADDAILYALGVGAGTDARLDELNFTTENSHGIEHRVLPTFAVVAGGRQRSADAPTRPNALGSVPMTDVLHGEQALTLHQALPSTGVGRSESTVTAIYDTGRHAVIEHTSVLRDAATGAVLSESRGSIVARGAGGFGGPPAPPVTWAVPPTPDTVIHQQTRPDQALLYRLSGDTNPLHSDPWLARAAGMPRPILHGLCTYGFTGRALLHSLCGGDVDRFGHLSARFSSPVFPGDALATAVWRTADGARFRVTVGDRVVLDRGVFRYRAEQPHS